MIQLVAHKNIDKHKWDNCVTQSLNQSISSLSWYLDCVSENWSALIMDDYLAVFPLPVKSKYKINYLLQPIFVRSIGIYSKVNLTEELVNSFFDAIPNNIKLIDFYLKENISFNRVGFEVTNRKVQLLEMDQPYETIKQSYNRSVLKNLRKAEKNEIVITEDINPEKIAKQYQINIGAQVEKLNSTHFKIIEKLMIAGLKNKCGIKLAVINKNKETIASSFFMKTDSVIYFSFGSANEEGKSVGAMYLMVDEIIKRYAQQVKLFDFEGSDVEGIGNFNRNFGAKDFVYLRVQKNRLPSIVKWMSKKNN
jgi:hypothetical protein